VWNIREHNAQEEIAIAAARSVLNAHQKKLSLVAVSRVCPSREPFSRCA